MLSEQQQRIMGYFIEEAKDHLNTLEQGLLSLQNTIEDSEMISEVFRAAHSVKGGAAMLGLNSIQQTSHRLEDYFKVLRECPAIKVDQKLETLFLRVFDTLQELLEQLQGPFGLTDDKADEVMAEVEPVFAALNEHLSNLVEQAGGTPPDDVDLSLNQPVVAAAVSQPLAMARSQSAQEESALNLIFQSDIPEHLREMLQLFKQPDGMETRQRLQEHCRSMRRAGEQFDLPDWCDLLEKSQQAIANPDNTYRTLAPIVIKEIKRAQELVLSGHETEVVCSGALEALVPAAPEFEDADLAELLETSDLTGVEAVAESISFEIDGSAQDFALTDTEEALADFADSDDWFGEAVSAQDASLFGETEEALDLQGSDAASTDDLFPEGFDDFDVSASSAAPTNRTGPEVGMAELNSLADLFEGEVPDLGMTWQEEEILVDSFDEIAFTADVTGDFSDLLLDQSDSEDLGLDFDDDEDLSGLLTSSEIAVGDEETSDLEFSLDEDFADFSLEDGPEAPAPTDFSEMLFDGGDEGAIAADASESSSDLEDLGDLFTELDEEDAAYPNAAAPEGLVDFDAALFDAPAEDAMPTAVNSEDLDALFDDEAESFSFDDVSLQSDPSLPDEFASAQDQDAFSEENSNTDWEILEDIDDNAIDSLFQEEVVASVAGQEETEDRSSSDLSADLWETDVTPETSIGFSSTAPTTSDAVMSDPWEEAFGGQSNPQPEVKRTSNGALEENFFDAFAEAEATEVTSDESRIPEAEILETADAYSETSGSEVNEVAEFSSEIDSAFNVQVDQTEADFDDPFDLSQPDIVDVAEFEQISDSALDTALEPEADSDSEIGGLFGEEFSEAAEADELSDLWSSQEESQQPESLFEIGDSEASNVSEELTEDLFAEENASGDLDALFGSDAEQPSEAIENDFELTSLDTSEDSSDLGFDSGLDDLFASDDSEDLLSAPESTESLDSETAAQGSELSDLFGTDDSEASDDTELFGALNLEDEAESSELPDLFGTEDFGSSDSAASFSESLFTDSSDASEGLNALFGEGNETTPLDEEASGTELGFDDFELDLQDDAEVEADSNLDAFFEEDASESVAEDAPESSDWLEFGGLSETGAAEELGATDLFADGDLDLGSDLAPVSSASESLFADSDDDTSEGLDALFGEGLDQGFEASNLNEEESSGTELEFDNFDFDLQNNAQVEANASLDAFHVQESPEFSEEALEPSDWLEFGGLSEAGAPEEPGLTDLFADDSLALEGDLSDLAPTSDVEQEALLEFDFEAGESELIEGSDETATSGDLDFDAFGSDDFDFGEEGSSESGFDLDGELNASEVGFDLDDELSSSEDEFSSLEFETDFSSPDLDPVAETAELSIDDDFADLDALLQEETPADLVEEAIAPDDDFADLEALLEDDIAPASGFDPDVVTTSGFQDDSGSTDEFDDLEKLLEDADQNLGGSPTAKGARRPSLSSSRRTSRRATGVLSNQTMRVSVKHLDNLNNLVGELVVNRNSLEQSQERLRQFLDNLLYQAQQLSDVGQRMRDLYERSLLESSLLSSRKSYQLSSPGNAPDSAQTSHSTGLSFDALEMDRFTGFHTLSQEMIELIVRVRESASDIDFVVDETDQTTRSFRQVTTQLQEGLTRSRMVPFAQTADRLPRAVRDISIKCGKQAEMMVEGRDTLIDKMILEQLYDPMTHLVNNAITHGIETPQERQAAGKPPMGRITIRTFHQGNQTVISVIDDGAGIDPEFVKSKAIAKKLITREEASEMSRLDVYDLLFHHGFSTKDRADDFSGRGVGMDVVRTSLNEIRGTINIDSAIGKGTTFTIRLPLTLSISKALCCISNRARIAFPMDGVEDMLDVPKDRVQTNDEGQSCILWRDILLPFRPLSELLKYNRSLSRGSVYGGNQEEDIISVVVLRSAGNFLALQVDQVLGEQEIVIKQLEGPVPKPIGIAGATVLGDGRIMPIADVLELIDLSMGRIRREAGSSLWDKGDDQMTVEPPAVKTDPTVLIVDDSITVRELLSMTFNKVGYRVEQARDGQEAWEKLRSGLPCDLVFCDIEMPRMDGLELLSRIQKDPNLSHLPIAMLTSRGADRHRQMAVQLGAKGYFTKPYLEEALLDAAQRMLKGEVLVNRGTSDILP